MKPVSYSIQNVTQEVASRGRRQVGTVILAERRARPGCYVPPMLIYPRKEMQQKFETGLG